MGCRVNGWRPRDQWTSCWYSLSEKDGPELRHEKVEEREQIGEWAKRESGQSVGPDGCGGMKGEGKQPHPGWLLGFCYM